MSILNKDYIKSSITNNLDKPVNYRWTHGATDLDLGDGLLIYSIIQYMRAKVCVCLGSGGGFIPRIMTKARQDLHQAGIFEGDDSISWGDIGVTFVVDAANKVGGEVDWLDKDSYFRKTFCPRIINDTTEKAYYNFFVKEDIKIDYLHIDAGHSYKDVKQDFELYSKLLSEKGIISIHDTDKSFSEDYIITKDIKDQDHFIDFNNGPAKFMNELLKDPNWNVFNLFNNGILRTKPSSTGLTIVQNA
jgi:hypothetical protein